MRVLISFLEYITPFDAFKSFGYLKRCGTCWQAYDLFDDVCFKDAWCSNTNSSMVKLIGKFRNIQFVTRVLIQRPHDDSYGRVTKVEIQIDGRQSFFGEDRSGMISVSVMQWAATVKVIYFFFDCFKSVECVVILNKLKNK